jgi:hypothetical protein
MKFKLRTYLTNFFYCLIICLPWYRQGLWLAVRYQHKLMYYLPFAGVYKAIKHMFMSYVFIC